MRAEELDRHLRKSGTRCTVFILTGGERLLEEECVESIRDHFEKVTKERFVPLALFPQQNSQATERIEASQVLDELRTASLFGDRKLVVVHDAAFLYSQFQESFDRYFAAPSGRNVLVMAIPNFRLQGAGADAMAVVICEAPFDSPPPWRPQAAEHDTPLAAWTAARARGKHKKRMTLQTAYSLTLRTGRSLGKIDGELLKLALYVGGRDEIFEDDVSALAGRDSRGSLGRIAERIFAKDLAGALSMSRLLFERGFVDRGGAPIADSTAVALMAIATIHSELRKLWRMKRAIARGVDGTEIMRRLKITKDFHYAAAAKRAELWTDAELTALLGALVDLDAIVKSSASRPDAAFEQMILTQLPYQKGSSRG